MLLVLLSGLVRLRGAEIGAECTAFHVGMGLNAVLVTATMNEDNTAV